MKLRLLLIPITAFCMISSCSSCGDGAGNNNGSGTGDHTDIGNGNGNDNNSNNTTASTENLTEAEQIQFDINRMIEQEMSHSKSSKSGNVEGIIASFELGMNTREVKVHLLRLKQKDLLVRVQKSANVFEYVYQLKLKSGKSNTFLDFEYNRQGGLYRAACVPNMLKGVSKSTLLKEVRDLLSEWYGSPSFSLPSTKSCEHYIWIKGNRHVDLHCTTKGVEFVYTDLNSKIPPNIEAGGEDRPDVKVVL